MNEDPRALFMLAVEMKPMLSALKNWSVVGWFSEELVKACFNEGGFTYSELQRMRAWSYRWQKIGLEAREFYIKTAHKDNGVSWALQQVLQGRAHEIKPGLKGYVQGQFHKTTGSSCPCDLFPDFRKSSSEL